MRILRRISAFICMLLVLTVGILFIFTATIYMTGIPLKTQLDAKIDQYQNDLSGSGKVQVVTFAIGSLLLLVSCLTIYLAIADIQSSGRIRLESAGGKLTVSASAIEDHINRLGRNIEGVKELKCRIRRTPTGWGLYARVTVFSDQNVKEVNEKIREQVKQGIISVIGDHSIEPIDIHVTKIAERGRVGGRRNMDVEFTA